MIFHSFPNTTLKEHTHRKHSEFLVQSFEPPEILWNYTYGVYDHQTDERAYSGVETRDGGLAFIGDAPGAGKEDFWFVKTDVNGKMEWNQTFGGREDDVGFSLIEAKDGGFILVGITNSFGAGGTDAWMIKTDQKGNLLWNHTYGGISDDQANAIIQTTDGGYAIVGTSASFGLNGYFDAWLLKTDSEGNLQWNKTFGFPDWDEAEAIIQISDGFLFTGHTIVDDMIYFQDAWLVKTDANGDMVWNRTYNINLQYGISPSENSRDLIPATDGGYILAGNANEWQVDSGMDFWIIKVDDDGASEWNYTYGGASLERAYAITHTTDGGYAVVGKTDSYGGGQFDFWILKLNSLGVLQWNMTFGTEYDEVAFDILETFDGGLVIFGYTTSVPAGALVIKIGGDFHDSTGSSMNHWIIKFSLIFLLGSLFIGSAYLMFRRF